MKLDLTTLVLPLTIPGDTVGIEGRAQLSIKKTNCPIADAVTSLSLLSYTTKLELAHGAFGRDSMISALLLEPILSRGKGRATEAVIAGVLERLNMTDGSLYHKRLLGMCLTSLEEIQR